MFELLGRELSLDSSGHYAVYSSAIRLIRSGVRVMVQLDLVGLQKALEFELLSGWLWLVAVLD